MPTKGGEKLKIIEKAKCGTNIYKISFICDSLPTNSPPFVYMSNFDVI